MKIINAVSLVLLFLQAVSAQTTVPSDREALIRGEGMGLAGYAERNGFPGPKHVLDLKDTLRLTNDQLRMTETLVARVKDHAQKLGERIVRAEEQLNKLFAGQHSVEEEKLQSALKEIARLRSDLRFVHLQAHLEMNKALTREQRHLYALLRGIETSHAH